MASAADPHVLFHVDDQVGQAFSWLSIGLAVLTALVQGLVTALTLMTESSTRWTFRFRLALLEHWWWTIVSIMLLASLIMASLSFVSGNGGDPVSVLALSSATFLAMVQYMLPAWQYRHYTKTRWLAWTGPSRTAIDKKCSRFCGNAALWSRLVNKTSQKLAVMQRTESDRYGWRVLPVRGIKYDPTDVLRTIDVNDPDLVDNEKVSAIVGVYANASADSATVSLLWGREQDFRPRVSRAVSSMPLSLLKSSPLTVDGYDGKGLTTAMGILGRNKGLQPWKLVFKMDSTTSTFLETRSTWTPRPAKVLRSFYKQTLQAQFGGLGEDFVKAAIELALLMVDVPHWAVNHWLSSTLEHQSLSTNQFLASTALGGSDQEERAATLTAHYESSYVSMIISLNAMNLQMRNRHAEAPLARPDITCTALLLKARGFKKPRWWKRLDVQKLRREQDSCLAADLDWRTAAARLLGLDEYPATFSDPSLGW